MNWSGHLGQHAPVRAELECHHNSRYDPQAECHTEYLEPKLKEDAIRQAAGREMKCLENGEPGGQSDTEGRKDDVERDGERELKSRQDKRRGIHRSLLCKLDYRTMNTNSNKVGGPETKESFAVIKRDRGTLHSIKPTFSR